jgi:hypothetical protein
LYNPKYADIEINVAAVQALPEDSNLSVQDVRFSYVDNENGTDGATDGPEEGPNNERVRETVETFLPVPQDVLLSNELLEQKVDAIAFPNVLRTPLNEYETEGLATICFPARFPRGSGDPTMLVNRVHEVKISSGFRHLLKLRIRNSCEPRFVNWAQNIVERRRTISQASFFLKKNPGVASMDLEDLQRVAQDPNERMNLLNKMSVYSANITGSNSYWYLRQCELIDTFNTKGAGTIFLSLFHLLICIGLRFTISLEHKGLHCKKG